MRVLIAASTDLQASAATDALAAARPEWVVRCCLTDEDTSAALQDGGWEAAVLDVARIPSVDAQTLYGVPFIAWGDEEQLEDVIALMEAGAAGHLIRSQGWQRLLPAVVARAAAIPPRSFLPPTEWPYPLHQADAAAAICVCNAPEFPAILETGLAQASKVIPFECALMALQDVESGDMDVVAKGLRSGRASELASVLLAALSEEQLEGCVAPVIFADASELVGTDALDALREELERAELAGICRVSLTTGDEMLGALIFGCGQPIRATPAEAIMLTDLGIDIALAVARVLLSRQAARARQAQQTVLSVALALSAGNDLGDILQFITRAAIDVANGEWACLRVLDEGRLTFHRAHYAPATAPSGGDSGPDPDEADWHAIETGEPVLRENGGPDNSRIQLTLPMTLDLNTIGTLTVRRKSGSCFPASETSALRLLCAQAAVAVHNANLYEIASRRSQHMEVVAAQAWQEEARARALFEIATAVTEKVDLPDILAHVARSACEEIGFEVSRIYLADHEHQTLVAQLEATAGTDPAPVVDERIPLRPDCRDPLAQAALGSAPYVIDAPEEEGGFERLLIPLVSQGMLIGLLMAGNPQTRMPVSPQRTRLLHSLAGLAGVAIERARVEKLRGTLISSVSHELRAPLASIRAYNELVMEGDAGEVNDEQRMFLERVEHACARLERLIQDLMNLSKLRTGEVSLRKAPCDLANAVRAVMDTIHPRAIKAGVTLTFTEEAAVPPIITDQGRLEQVLMNLVDNAIKFNDRGGSVDLRLTSDEDTATISVADDGPGIPASAQATIFEEFQHGTDDRSRAKDGAGLGLAIARRWIAVLGGKLWVASEIGEGSTFYVSLQLEPAQGTQPAPPQSAAGV